LRRRYPEFAPHNGGLWTRLEGIQANGGSGDEAILIEEADAGSLSATLTQVVANGNKKEGLEVNQDPIGTDTGTLVLRSVTLENNQGGPQSTTGVTVTAIR